MSRENPFVGRRVSVIRALNGHCGHPAQSLVKDEPLDLNSDGASVGSNGVSLEPFFHVFRILGLLSFLTVFLFLSCVRWPIKVSWMLS